MRRAALPLALVGAAVPAILLGCGGGGSSSSSPSTPSVPATIILPQTSFSLANGQYVTLNLTRTSNNLSGTAKISNTFPRTLRGGATNLTLPFQIPEGTYNVSGAFAAPSSFTLTGTAGDVGAFTLTGTFPISISDGTYSLSIGGITETGVIPVGGAVANTTPTPTATVVGAVSNYRLSANLVISNGGGLTFEPRDVDTGANAFTDFSGGGFLTGTGTGRQFLRLQAARPSANVFGENLIFNLALQSRSFSQTGAAFFAGQRLSLAPSPASNGTNVNQLTLRLFDSAYVSTSGRATIRTITPNSQTVVIVLTNVILELQPDTINATPTASAIPSAFATSTPVPGAVTTPTVLVNGTITATGLTVNFQARAAGETR